MIDRKEYLAGLKQNLAVFESTRDLIGAEDYSELADIISELKEKIEKEKRR